MRAGRRRRELLTVRERGHPPEHEGFQSAVGLLMGTWLPNTPRHVEREIEHGMRSKTRGVVIHTIEGSDEGAISWFANPQAGGVGAHVVVGHTPPRAVQLADLDAKCWHAAGANETTIGIEHEGRASDSRWAWVKRRTQRKLSANRTAWILYHYGLGAPKHRVNVWGHVDWPEGGHHDPGGGWPWALYMAACRRAYRRLQKTHGREWA